MGRRLPRCSGLGCRSNPASQFQCLETRFLFRAPATHTGAPSRGPSPPLIIHLPAPAPARRRYEELLRGQGPKFLKTRPDGKDEPASNCPAATPTSVDNKPVVHCRSTRIRSKLSPSSVYPPRPRIPQISPQTAFEPRLLAVPPLHHLIFILRV